jgi:hypothetical protein
MKYRSRTLQIIAQFVLQFFAFYKWKRGNEKRGGKKKKKKKKKIPLGSLVAVLIPACARTSMAIMCN